MARLHSSQQDFELVGMDDDPTPGDPELIRGVQQRYQDIGDAAEKALNVLKKDGTISVGRGSAMDKLKQKIGDDLPDKLTKTMRSYHDAAQAYADYIPKLQEAQDTFDRAVEQAQTAAPTANQQPKTLGDNPSDQDRADAKKTQDTIDAGKSELNAAKSLAEQARSMRQTAQRATADVLDRAAGEAIPERNIFQKIADFFKDFPFVQILLGLLIAVVSVFFPVAGALLGGALFLATELPAIASGHFDLGDLLVGLVGLIPGGALLKVGGGLVKGAAEAILPGAAKAISGSIKGIKSTVDTSKTLSGVANVAGNAAEHFVKDASQEATDEAVHGKTLDAGAIFGAGALGAVTGASRGGSRGKGKPGGPPGSSDRGLGPFGKKSSGTGGAGGAGGSGGGGKKPGFSFGSLFGKGKNKRPQQPQQPPQPPNDPNIPPGHLPSAQAGPGPANIVSGGTSDPVPRITDEPLFRVDDRPPSQIFANGFHPHPPGPSGQFLGNIAAHNAVSTHGSGFVSATTRPDYIIAEGHQFEIHAPGGFDTNASVPDVAGNPNVIRFEQEIQFPGGVRPQNIVGARPINDDNTLGALIPNPHFNPNAINHQFPNHLPFNNPQPAAAPPAAPAQPPPGGSQQQPVTSAFVEGFGSSGSDDNLAHIGEEG